MLHELQVVLLQAATCLKLLEPCFEESYHTEFGEIEHYLAPNVLSACLYQSGIVPVQQQYLVPGIS